MFHTHHYHLPRPFDRPNYTLCNFEKNKKAREEEKKIKNHYEGKRLYIKKFFILIIFLRNKKQIIFPKD